MIEKALNIFNSVFDFVQKFVWILTIVFGLTSFASFKGCSKFKEKAENKADQIEHVVSKFKLDSNRIASEVINWKMNAKELERKNFNLKQENNVILKEKDQAYKIIKDYDIKLKNAENYIKLELKTKDTLYTPIVFNCDTLEIKPIDSKFLSLDFLQTGNELQVIHEYNNTVYTVISLFPKRIKNEKRKRYGEPHFPNWGFLWGWEEKTTSSTEDPNATIENIVEISFEK